METIYRIAHQNYVHSHFKELPFLLCFKKWWLAFCYIMVVFYSLTLSRSYFSFVTIISILLNFLTLIHISHRCKWIHVIKWCNHELCLCHMVIPAQFWFHILEFCLSVGPCAGREPRLVIFKSLSSYSTRVLSITNVGLLYSLTFGVC